MELQSKKRKAFFIYKKVKNPFESLNELISVEYSTSAMLNLILYLFLIVNVHDSNEIVKALECLEY